MRKIVWSLQYAVRNRRAQILLPAVMLAPIFILVVYLLFETAKLSMTKVRNQFALDNAAYAHMSSASTYLNATAMVNGNLPYRVMRTMASEQLIPKASFEKPEKWTVFDLFYRAGAFPAIGPDHEKGASENPRPAAESNNWQFKYYGDKRANWNKEDPSEEEKDKVEGAYILTDPELAENYFFSAQGTGLTRIKEYLTIFVRTGSIYMSQSYVYKDITKKGHMFRESYWLNTKDCRKSECAKQASSTLERFQLELDPFEIESGGFYITNAQYHGGAYLVPINFTEAIKTKLFQFAYLTGGSRSRLKQMSRGIVLKQKYELPENRFNINLTQRYKPYVRNTITLSCPRGSNNCVWPNPLPKYTVKVGV